MSVHGGHSGSAGVALIDELGVLAGSKKTLQRRAGTAPPAAGAPAGGAREACACAADCSRRRRMDALAPSPASAPARAPTK